MLYSFQHTPLKINDQKIYANNLQLELKNELTPNYIVGQDIDNSFSYTDNVNGRLRVSYYLTGSDFLTQYILRSSQMSFSGCFGGLTFSSGYLTSYSVNLQANSPLIADCEIALFENLAGTLNPSTEISFSDNPNVILHGRYLQIESLTGLDTTDVPFNSVSWQYKAEIKPEYYAKTNGNNITPDRVVIGKREIDTQFSTQSSDFSMPPSGKLIAVKLKAYNHDGLLQEFYLSSGLLNSRAISAGINKFLENSFSVVQVSETLNQTNTIVGAKPEITGFFPPSGEAGTIVTVLGQNLLGVSAVNIGDGRVVRPLAVYSDNVRFAASPDSTTGPIYLHSYYPTYTANTSTSFIFIYPPISIDTISPDYGEVGKRVNVLGKNFYNISKVTIGQYDATFLLLSPTKIWVTIPDYAPDFIPDYITVFSNKSNNSGSSPFKFSPVSQVTAIFPTDVRPGDIVQVSGKNFYNLQTVRIKNSITDYFQTCNIFDSSPTGITIDVPINFTTNPIRIDYVTDFGTPLNASSKQSLRPLAVLISGFYDSSNTQNAIFTNNQAFYGIAYNLDQSILNSEQIGNDVYFYVDFGGQKVRVRRQTQVGVEDYLNPMRFDGITPVDGPFGGLASIEDKNGNPYPNSEGIYMLCSLPPEIDESFPTDFPLYSTVDQIRIVGHDLFDWIYNDTRAMRLGGVWVNQYTWVQASFNFDFASGLLVSPLDLAAETATFDSSTTFFSGGALNYAFKNPFAIVKLATNDNAWNYVPYRGAVGTADDLLIKQPYASRDLTYDGTTKSIHLRANTSYDSKQFFDEINPISGWIYVRNQINTSYIKKFPFEWQHPENKLLLANGSPVSSLCNGVVDVKFWKPNDTYGQPFTVPDPTDARKNIGYYTIEFDDIDDVNRTVIQPKHVLQDDLIPNSPSKQTYWQEIIQNGTNGNLPLYHHIYHYHTPYYVLKATNGAWVYDFSNAQDLQYIAIQTQDKYHQGVALNGISQRDNYSIAGASSLLVNIFIYDSSNTLLKSTSNLEVLHSPSNNLWAYQGYAYNQNKSDGFYKNNRTKVNLYQAQWVFGLTKGVKRIKVTNTQASPLALSLITAY